MTPFLITISFGIGVLIFLLGEVIRLLGKIVDKLYKDDTEL